MATLLDALESAAVAYLTAQSVGATVVAGISATDKPDPIVICTAQRLELGEEGANAECTLLVEIKSATPTTFKTVCEAVQDALWLEDSETLGTQLEQAGTDIRVYGARATPNIEREISEDMFIERHTIVVHAGVDEP